MKKDARILISGAGIAGPAVAYWLAQAGMKPVMVEKAQSSRVGGFLVALTHQAYYFAEEMGVMPALREYDLKIQASSYHDRTGHSLLDLEYQKLFDGLGIIQISRDDLANALYNHVKDEVETRFGDHITAIDQNDERTLVTFASGKKEEYDVVIGADGVHSSVRTLNFSDDEYTHHYLDLFCAAFKLPNIVNIESKFETHMERKRYMVVHNTLGEEINAVFVWDDPERLRKIPPPGPERRDFLLSAYEDTSPITRKVLEHCPENEPFYMDALCQIELPVWHRGRCVLVGDSAYSLTPFSGRGAGSAFAGACRLGKALVEQDYEQAFQTFEAQERPVISDIQPATRNAVKWYVPRTAFNHALRDGLMRFVPNVIFRQYFKNKYSKV